MTENPGIIKAWHFVGATLRNGEPIPPDGEWLIWDGPLEMCRLGLHASIHPFDALSYAPGDTLCQVECQGYVLGNDKLVARRRRILKRKNVNKLLRRFAKDQALSVAHLWNPPQIVMDYLKSDSEAARTAAWGAAREAAWGAAREAAWGAAREAAWEAAWGAARGAAWGAAREAAWGAAWGAAQEAARDAALEATWEAARGAFLERVEKEFGS